MTNKYSIQTLKAREIFDSRGNPTIEVEVQLVSGICGSASVPSGVSCGSREVKPLHDTTDKRLQGKGVQQAVNNVHGEIASLLVGHNVLEQSHIDKMLNDLDASPYKQRLGANAILAVSLACARGASKSLGIPLYRYVGGLQVQTMPVPFINVINGGQHADNPLAFQEFMLLPILFSSFRQAFEASAQVFWCLRAILQKQQFSVNVGDEGGFAPDFTDSRQALEVIAQAIHKAGFVLGKHFMLALDCAASEIFVDNKYHYDGKITDHLQLIQYLQKLTAEYHIVSIEDPIAEKDNVGWQEITKAFETHTKNVLLVGDDLFVTNYHILKQGIQQHMANSILIKPNQIGTLSETLQTIKLAHQHNYRTIISHRSGETNDDFIADLSIATASCGLKAGSLSRGERLHKYNRLLRLEDDNLENFVYQGEMFVVEDSQSKRTQDTTHE